MAVTAFEKSTEIFLANLFYQEKWTWNILAPQTCKHSMTHQSLWDSHNFRNIGWLEIP